MSNSSPSGQSGRGPRIGHASVVTADHPHSWVSALPPSEPTAASLVIDDLLAARPEHGVPTVPERSPAVPTQSKPSSTSDVPLPPIDALLHPPIFDAAAFRNLRERLFAGLPPSAFPRLSAPADEAGDLTEVPLNGAEHALGLSEPVGSAALLLRGVAWGGASTRRRRLAAMAGGAALVTAAVAVVVVLARLGEEPVSRQLGTGPQGSASGSVATAAGTATSTVAIGRDGAMTVETQLVLPASVGSFTMSVPDPETARAAASYRPQVTDIEAVPDGAIPISVADLGPGSSETVSLPDGTSTVTVTYRVAGAVVHTKPSPRLRRAVLATPLMISAEQPIAATIAVPHATNFGCWAPRARTSVVCGEPTRDGWEVALKRGGDIVIAQLDLPR